MGLFNNKNKLDKAILDYNGNRIYINGLLISAPKFKEPTSLKSGSSVTYDVYLQEFTDKFFKKLNKAINTTETQTKCKEINDAFVFALNNLVDIPSSLRDYFFGIVTKYIDLLKKAVGYPETIVNDQVAYYLPLLKELSLASKNFLLNNK